MRDANWINKDAKGVVDIIFVLDASGSVSDRQCNNKLFFVKHFLEYYSISRAEAQVNIISYIWSESEVLGPFSSTEQKWLAIA